MKLPAFSPILFLWLAGMIGNVLTWYVSFLFVRKVDAEVLALLNLQSNGVMVISILVIAWQLTVAKWWHAFPWQRWLQFTGTLACLCTLLYLAYIFFVGDNLSVLSLSMISSFIVFFFLALIRGGMIAQQELGSLSWTIIIEGLIRLLWTGLVLIWAPAITLLLGIPVSLLVSWLLGWLLLPDLAQKETKDWRSLLVFWGNSIGLQVSVLLPMSLDLLVLAHFWDLDMLGRYSYLVFWGKTIFFVMYSFIGILVPLLLQKNLAHPVRAMGVILGLVALAGVGGWGVLWLMPAIIFFIVPQFPHELLPIIPWYGISITSLGLIATISTATLLKGKSQLMWISLLVTLGLIGGLIRFHSSIEMVVHLMAWIFGGGALVNLAVFVVQLWSSVTVYGQEKKAT